MEKEKIKEIFKSSFDEKNFEDLMYEMFENADFNKTFVHAGSYIKEKFRESVKSSRRIGKYIDSDYRTIDFLMVNLRNKKTLEKSRTTQKNFIADYLNEKDKNSAIVCFYTDEDRSCWRLSFVEMQYIYDKEKNKIKQEFTPAKRFSFLVGNDEATHTCCERFVEFFDKLKSIKNPVIKDIEEIFNVEVVTKEFYEQYRGLYEKLVRELENLRKKDKIIDNDFEEKNISNKLFCKKILGQIVFLYFIQKKGWLGVDKNSKFGLGDKQFLRNLFNKTIEENKNFFNDYLEHLFYKALAQKNENDYFKLLDCKIPFLNGGLFEPIKNYDWTKTDIIFENELFSNKNKTAQGDIGDGILDIFDKFNFTIYENEPLETEVAIDPEMLGKVFESMLDVEDRKEKGAFYTPKEIVQYMCQESLINYLNTKFPEINKEDFEYLIKYAEIYRENDKQSEEKQKKIESGQLGKTDYKSKMPPDIITKEKEIDEALENIKVCDPAIGSGAFPVGMMNEIVRARLNLLKRTENSKDKYNFKLQAIENSIYGVDVEDSAVEIAKLRFWLSLIIEEDSEEIKTMPNLDYKIVCGNSLLNIEIDLFNSEELKELEKLKHDYINLSDKEEKIKTKEKIDSILNRYAREGQFDFEVFFSEVFSSNGGFDVIIANPPYVQLQKLKNSLIEEGIYKGKTYQKLYKEQNYKVYEGMGDLYCLFYEKGINILRNNGILTYITSNKWMRAGYGGSLREYLIKYNPLVLIDLGSNIFESATVDTNILLVKKESYKKNTLSCFYREHKKDLGDYVKQNNVSMEYTKDNWVILDPIEKSIKEKVEKYGKKLKDWDITINYGIKTGCNEAFIINEEVKNKLIEEDPRSEELIKPVLRGKDIKRNKINYKNLYLITTFPAKKINIDEFKSIKNWLENGKWLSIENLPTNSGKLRLEQSGKAFNFDKNLIKSRKFTSNKWFETQDQIAYYSNFNKPKIIYPEISQNNNFYYDQEGKYYINNTAYIITGNKNGYLIKLLNSKITEFIFGNYYCIILGDGGLRWKYQEIINLPVLYPTEQQEKEILNAKTDEEIDALIAKYYHLTEEEFEFIKNYRR